VAYFRYDYGVIVPKMKLWVGDKNFDGNSMLAYNNVSYRSHILVMIFERHLCTTMLLLPVMLHD